MKSSYLNFPLFLTLFRLIVSPLVLPLLIFWFFPLNNFLINSVLTSLFFIFGLTDFLDGYWARKYKQETFLGKILDPIADKFLMFSTLVTLLAVGRIYFYWVIILIGRDFFIMGLRETALQYGFGLSVVSLGKCKTILQMLLCGILILNPYPYRVPLWWDIIETSLLVLTLLITLVSAINYYFIFLKNKNT